MRTAVIFFSSDRRERILNITRALAKGIEAQGHQTDIIDGDHDINAKLTIYQYIVIGTEPASALGGRIPSKIEGFLMSSGMITGKKSYAFVTKNFFGSGKALSRLMKSMEKEGMFLKNSGILNSPQEAEEIGKRLHI